MYAEFFTLAYANIVFTDLKLEVGKKDLITWNIADDICRKINKIENEFRKKMTNDLLVKYCDMMYVFEEKIEKKANALKEICPTFSMYAFMWNMLMINSVNINAYKNQGTLAQLYHKDIQNTIDRRFKDLLKRDKVLYKCPYIYRSKEYKDIENFLNSTWHMERVYGKKDII